jgi:probable HAF family extracellular repeat protein
MKPTLMGSIAGAALLATLAFPAYPEGQRDAPRQRRPHFARYEVTDLGTLGGPYSLGLGINSRGVVAGGAATVSQNGNPNVANPQPPLTGFLWKDGHMVNLGTLGDPRDNLNSEAGGPNIHNESALISETGSLDPNGEDFCYFGTHRQCLAAIWKHGRLSALRNPFGGNNSQAYWINDFGQVTGFAETSEYDASCATQAGPDHPLGGKPFQLYRFKAVVWNPDGSWRELRPYGDDTVSFAMGINNKGQAVGTSGLCSNVDFPPSPQAFRSILWQADGTPVDLGGLGGASSGASAINDRGDVDGTATTADGLTRAYLWTKESGQPHNLGSLHPDDPLVVATCCNTVNNYRQVVGFVLDANFNSYAFLWQDGRMVDLNTLIPNDSGWTLQSADSINDAGQITGWGLINGEVHAFLAAPCDREDDH